MSFRTKVGLVTVVAILCIATCGATIRLLAVEATPLPVVFLMLLATSVGGLYCLWEAGRILSKEIETRAEERWRYHVMQANKMRSRDVALPQETVDLMESFLGELEAAGHQIAKSLTAGAVLKEHMGKVAVHINDVATENVRLRQEEAKVREAHRILGRSVDNGARPPAFLRAPREDQLGALEREMAQYLPRSHEDVIPGEDNAAADGHDSEREPSPRPAV